MEFIFIILSWLILLVPGFDDSVPPTGDKIFKIETSPDIVQSITTRPYESFDFWEFDIKLKQNSTGNLDLKIPKNLPTPASNMGFWAYDSRAYVLVNGADIKYDIVEDPCYSHYKIPIDGKTNLEIVYTVIAAGSWQLYTPIQFDENNPCYNVVFYKKLDSPLKQFKSGISTEKIQCKEGLILIQKIDYSPACVKSESLEKLRERGWAKLLFEIQIQPSQTKQDLTEKSDQIITGLENDTGIITWKKQTYYFDAPYYTDDVYHHQVQILFHGVNFTLFPQPFNGGLPVDSCDGSNSGRYYWINAKFSDGTNELLHIFVNSKPCLDDIPIIFGNHTNPQAGLSFSNNRMKLLVSTDSDLVVPRGDLFLQQPLRIEGLNETYSVGQKIEFTVKFNGTGYDCGYPQLRIENDNHDIVWESSGIVSLCDPDMKKDHIEKEWKIDDNTHFGTPIVDKGGHYTLFVTFSDDIIQKDFVVRW